MTIGEITELVEKTSTSFETADKEVKKRYLLWNIAAFNVIASKVSVGIATFGTGYPFYVLNQEFSNDIPNIPEQIRYNRQLVRESGPAQKSIFECQRCLGRNYDLMKDLKTICLPCPKMPDCAKPRKLINRLPDLDMWLVCEDRKIEEAKKELKCLLEKNNMIPSDVEPLVTIDKVKEISEALKKGELPSKDMYLPIDTHIVEYSYLKDLIEEIPREVQESVQTRQTPYLPIHPISLRKDWQYDDTAYNFISDFLASFTPYGFPEELYYKVMNVRKFLSCTYTPDELYQILLDSTTDTASRRFRTPAVRWILKGKFDEWKDSQMKKLPLRAGQESPSTDDDL